MSIFAPPISYNPTFWADNKKKYGGYASNYFLDEMKPQQIKESLPAFVRHGSTPREEFYHHADRLPYTYGTPPHARTYESQANGHRGPRTILAMFNSIYGLKADKHFNALFANYYVDGRDHLGWHADDSYALDPASAILVFSIGEAREIWIKPNEQKFKEILDANPDHQYQQGEEVTKLLLGSGSLLYMNPGMQADWLHRIPKSSKYDAGPRVSMTIRRTLPVVDPLDETDED